MPRFTTREINGTYGSGHTPCAVFVYDYPDSTSWYVCEGGTVVNRAWTQELVDGVDVETVSDIDCFTYNKPINSEDELERACDNN